jgi:hypothetical protein
MAVKAAINLFGKNSAKKVRILGGDELNKIQEIISPSNIQRKYGGTAPDAEPGANNLFPPRMTSTNYEVNGEKFYLLEKIKNHRWLRSLDFWLNFGDLTIQPELQKIIDKSNITKEDILNKNEKINANLSKKISEVIFSQILPFVNNMKDFDMELKDIVGITENFLHKYDYLDEDEKNNVFSLISDNSDEINQLREEYNIQ